MVTHGYSRCEYDCFVYYRVLDDSSLLLLTLYVDDMLIAVKSKSHILHLKKMLSRKFDMKDLGSAKKILNMEIHRDRKVEKLWCDSQSAMDFAKNQAFHARTNHIDVRYHNVQEWINFKQIVLHKVHTNNNAADILTKTVTIEKFKHCLSLIHLLSC
ncbi:hypothetical protein RJ639_019265 [Escallonia herrerae]|uniref:Reverse transcriptase Ty1/copia-type domain-containing protein n=1 Tax=Escallonia herrerae TaxID=1293975 RepID=A0AA88V7W3_9ASTE|nr:hypothetical protein RJ639_019265 [Escallonia herrerae]